MHGKHCIMVFLIIFQFIMGPNSALAQEARLTNIVVTNTHGELFVYLNVEGAFRDKMKKAILSGVPATFSFFINLDRVRGYWFNKEISDITVTHTIKYNNLRKEFTIRRSWENNRPITVPSFEEARKLMNEIDGLKVTSLDRLTKNRKYRLSAKAELSKMTLPFYLHYILFFVSLWDFETDWYTIEFTY